MAMHLGKGETPAQRLRAVLHVILTEGGRVSSRAMMSEESPDGAEGAD
jgi:hypothetical protein